MFHFTTLRLMKYEQLVFISQISLLKLDENIKFALEKNAKIPSLMSDMPSCLMATGIYLIADSAN